MFSDMMFATKLLEIAKLEYKSESNISPVISNENNNELSFKWSYEATLLLVEEYRLQEKNLTSGKISHKKAWNNIASALSNKGCNVTGGQCVSKFHGMKRTYKAIKDHNAKTGNNSRTWPYMEIMESLLGERPFMSPLATASSSNTCYLARSDNSSSSSADVFSDVDISNPNPRKRKAHESTSKIAEAIIQSRDLAEKNKQQRHKEKMDFRKDMLKLLQKMMDES